MQKADQIMQKTEENQDFLIHFYEKYHKYVYKLAWSKCHQPDDVEDVVQSTWMLLCAKEYVLKELTAPKQFTYIAVTVKNIILENARKKKLDICSIDSVANIGYDGTAILERIFERRTKIENFAEVWQQVDEASREILERKYILEQSDAEIARSMKIGTNSVRTYVSRARKAARSVLQNSKDNLL